MEKDKIKEFVVTLDKVTEAQLRDAFSPYGQIKVVNLNLDPMTGKHKGFAFIWYDIPEAAQLAIETVRIT